MATLLLILLKGEAIPLWQGMLWMIVAMIVLFAAIGVGAYFFIKALAK